MAKVPVTIHCPDCGEPLYQVFMNFIILNGRPILEDAQYELEDELQFDSRDPEVAVIHCECCDCVIEIIDSEPTEYRLH